VPLVGAKLKIVLLKENFQLLKVKLNQAELELVFLKQIMFLFIRIEKLQQLRLKAMKKM
jgi:hypothetical protein